MVANATGRISRRKDGKCFLYLPKHLVEDTAFPFRLESSVHVQVSIDRLERKLIVEPLRRKQDKRGG